jgi:hypothetical protein
MINDDDDDEFGAVGGMRIGRGKRSYLEKTYPSVTLFTTNPTLTDLGSNPDRRVGKPTTNPLSYGTALYMNKSRNKMYKWKSQIGGL